MLTVPAPAFKRTGCSRFGTQLAFWDDHDFGLNDHDRTNPIKKDALQVFKEYWANPAYGLPDAPGVFFKYTYSSVDFFVLDVRYYRDPNLQPDSPAKTMLGKKQLEWLKNGLRGSQAPFKILLSGSGWSKAKGFGGDSWASYLHERNRIFNFIRDNEISGVVLLSGDTHVGELNVIPWSDAGGYDFYDLASSPLGQLSASSWMTRKPEKRVRPVFYKDANFGFIEFNFDDTPTLTFLLIDSSGRNAWTPFILRAGELRDGIKSWPDKIKDF